MEVVKFSKNFSQFFLKAGHMVWSSSIMPIVFFSMVVILYGLKYLKWPDFFFLIVSASRDHCKNFTSKHGNLGIIWKIYSGQLLSKNIRVNSYVSNINRVSKFVKQGSKNGKIKVIGLQSANFTAFLEFF